MLQKVENYRRAVERLREALSDLAQNPDSTVIRDGVIQRFEFTFELAWKSLREYLEDQGADMSGIVLSKQVFKAAYAAQIISDQQVWLDMLASTCMTTRRRPGWSRTSAIAISALFPPWLSATWEHETAPGFKPFLI